MKLPAGIQQEVEQLLNAGDALANAGLYRVAVEKYAEAITLLPEPQMNWDASPRLLAAIGDVNFLAGHYEVARLALTDAVQCPAGLGNPFIHLRLGQAQFELGDVARAKENLVRAYMGAGTEIFALQDPKYFECLETMLKPLTGDKK